MVLIDAAIQPELERAVAKELDEALCLGLSFFTGPMIGSAIRIRRWPNQSGRTCLSYLAAGIRA